MKKNYITSIGFIFFMMNTYSQINFKMPDNFCNLSSSTSPGPLIPITSSTNGLTHTPKGRLHTLVIFVKDLSQASTPLGYEGDIVNDPNNYWDPNDIPNWAKGASNRLFDSDPSTIGTIKNLSLFYREMSHGNFIVTGDIFPEMIPTATGSSAEIRDYLNINYPNFDWSKYDNRANNPNFDSDNSNSTPDNILDYVYLVYRRYGFNGNTGTGIGTVTTNFSGSPVNFTISDGHTALTSFNSASHHWIFYKHEFAHNLFNCPHYLGANSADGAYYYVSTGWGMMAGWHEQFDVANAWEQWWLGWITPQEIISDGIYQLKDFISQGDAIRIPLPNTNGEYLWIENHQKNDLNGFDDKPYYKPSTFTPLAQNIDKGIYMYVTKTASDRNNPWILYPKGINASNFIKVLNADGNADYNWTGEIIAVPGASSKNYVFRKNEDNPISGQNSWQAIRFNSDNNGIIDVQYHHGNGMPSANEQSEVWAESLNSIPTATYARSGKENQGFDVGNEISLSGILPVLNYPDYLPLSDKIAPFILNGISIKISSYNSTTGEYTLDIQFNDNDIRSPKRWCGNINLPSSIGGQPSINIKSGVTLKIDKSGTPNRKSEISPGSNDFINATEFTCLTNSFFHLDPNSTVITDNGSTLILENSSKLEVESGAKVIIRNGSVLDLKQGSQLIVNDGGLVVIESGGKLIYKSGAEIQLLGDNAVLEIQGTLEVGPNATFTFTYPNTTSGFVRFKTNVPTAPNIIAAPSSAITFLGADKNDKVLEVASGWVYPPDALSRFTIQNGKAELTAQSRLNIGCPLTIGNATVFGGGLNVFGQSFVFINNALFDGSGINGYLFFGKNRLSISNSTFRNGFGLRTIGEGVVLNNVIFENNFPGWQGIGVETTSSLTQCKIMGSIE